LMDADGQHDPQEIPRLVNALAEADIVFGARDLGWKSPWMRLAGNWVVNRTTRLLFGLVLRDIWCGYHAFRADVFPRIACAGSAAVLVQRLHVNRTMDLVMILGFMLLSVMLFMNHLELRRLQRKLQDLVREIALREGTPR